MENNTNTEAITTDARLIQVKALLEYYVSHLEWKVNHDRNFVGFSQYIEPNLNENGKLPVECGKGDGNGRIRFFIEKWCHFDDKKVCINVDGRQKQSETPTGWYLNWGGTGANIKSRWNQNHIEQLYLCIRFEKHYDYKSVMDSTIDELGLFDGKAPNEKLKAFWDRFEVLRGEWKAMDDKWWAEQRQGNQKTESQNVVTIVDELHDLITNNKNLVLTGAPGTGKTYLAKQLACKLVEAQEANPKKDKQYKNHVKFVQFHPSYDYTDFVEGLRPKNDDNGQLGFERKDGHFKKLCLAALEAPTENFVMIIDEINRGQVSKIFGELFFALDPDYRGAEGLVETQYQNMVPDGDQFKAGFYVPENVYIIGTMNDIDHSLEPLDFAFRRRFAWYEILAVDRFNMLEETAPFSDAPKFVAKVKAYFTRLNNKIGGDSGFGTAYQVGPAYFLKLKNFISELQSSEYGLNDCDPDQIEACMEKLWNTHLKPLLAECLKVNNDTSLTLEALEKAYYGADEEQD